MKTQYVDLHVHSTCSDGRFSPEELVVLAEKEGLVALALADHDNVDGIERAVVAARKTELEIIPAVELSSQWCDYSDLHLLGYGFDYHNSILTSELRQFQAYRASRNLQIIEKINHNLQQEGRDPIDPQQVRRVAGGSIGRPHIAQVLREVGYVSGNDEAFERYLIPCNVPKHYFPADEAIRLIHASGGVAVLAHPPYVTRDRNQLELLVSELVAFGLDGIEAYNNGSGLEDTDWLIRLAQRHQLVVTGGSDFHGEPGSIIEIGRGLRGLRVPYDCVEQIKQAQRQRGHAASWSM